MIFLEPYKKYADFSGRARRKEYWLFSLFYFLVLVFLTVLDAYNGLYNPEVGIGLLSGLFILITFIPYLAVACRRLHDTNRTGWWILISFIPLIGTIWFIVLCCFDSDAGDNRFGGNPKI